jgi:hypothetical protein
VYLICLFSSLFFHGTAVLVYALLPQEHYLHHLEQARARLYRRVFREQDYKKIQHSRYISYVFDVRRSLVRFLTEARDSYHLQGVQTGSGAHPTSSAEFVGAHWLGLKQPDREADHSPHLVSNLKMSGTKPLLPRSLSLRQRDKF